MAYRLLADENIERATITYLEQLGHDVEWVGERPELGLGIDDETIVQYASADNRLVLTQDDDFLTLAADHRVGVLFQTDETLSARTVGDIIDELADHIDQSTIVVEYVSRNWL